MSEGQGAPEQPDEAGRPPLEAPGGPAEPRPSETAASPRSPVDPAAVLLAVERIGADVGALSRALAAQPEEVAARVDVDAATAAIGVRVGALGSALDQFRLSLLAALDRTANRLDEPPWLPGLQAALTADAGRVEAPEWVLPLQTALDDIAQHVRTPGWLPAHQKALVELATTAVPAWLPDVRGALTELSSRVDAPEWMPLLQAALENLAEHLSAPSWLPRLHRELADLSPMPGEPRLNDVIALLTELRTSLAAQPGPGKVLHAPSGLAVDRRLDDLAATIAGLSDERRLDAVATTLARLADDHRLDEVTATLARVADDARALVEQVGPVPDRLSAIASQVDRITPLARAGDQAGSLFDQLDRVGTGLQEVLSLLRQPTGPAEEGAGRDDDRFDGIIDVLSGVTRRQDQLTAAITTALGQTRGPTGLDAVFERMEQRERALAARLDRIDAELRRGRAGSAVEEAQRADADAAQAVQALTVMFEQQDRVLGFRLDYIGAELERLRESAPQPAEAPDRLDFVLERLQQQEASLASQLTWVGDRLAEVAAHLVPDEARVAEDRDGLLEALASITRRQDELAATIAARQDELAATIARSDEGQAPGSTAERLSDLAQRQEDLLAALEGSVGEPHGPMAPAAVFDRMEQRERSLAARLDRIDLQLRQQGGTSDSPPPEGGLGPEGADAVASSIDAIATVTEDLQALVNTTAERLERRLADVEAAVNRATSRPRPDAPAPAAAPARPTAAAEAAALRLAQLRAERALVQARLQEERLLAAEQWDE